MNFHTLDVIPESVLFREPLLIEILWPAGNLWINEQDLESLEGMEDARSQRHLEVCKCAETKSTGAELDVERVEGPESIKGVGVAAAFRKSNELRRDIHLAIAQRQRKPAAHLFRLVCIAVIPGFIPVGLC